MVAARMRFIPTYYGRLVQRHADVVRNHVRYELDLDKLENPDCTIIPVMFHKTVNDETNIYLEYEGKVYHTCGINRNLALSHYLNAPAGPECNQLTLYVRIGEQPIPQDVVDVPAA